MARQFKGDREAAAEEADRFLELGQRQTGLLVERGEGWFGFFHPTFKEYLADENLRLAVERRIEIIGEAAGCVSLAFREAHPQIPWRKIIAQRNILAHQYGEVDDEILWRVATVSVPELITLVEPLVPPPPAGADR